MGGPLDALQCVTHSQPLPDCTACHCLSHSLPPPTPTPALLPTCDGILLRLKVHIQNEVARLLALVLQQQKQLEGQVDDGAGPGNAGAHGSPSADRCTAPWESSNIWFGGVSGCTTQAGVTAQ